MSKPAPAAPPGNRSRFNRFLDAIETAGNKLPDPVFIFIIRLLSKPGKSDNYS